MSNEDKLDAAHSAHVAGTIVEGAANNIFDGASSQEEQAELIKRSILFLHQGNIQGRQHHELMARKKSVKQDWSEDAILTAESPLVGTDLHRLFLNPQAWNVLSDEEKNELRSLLPAKEIEDGGNIKPEFLKYNNEWRRDCRLFQGDLEAGKHDPEWLKSAADAMEARAAGEFDDWKEKNTEAFWGQKHEVSRNADPGQAAVIRLGDMMEGFLNPKKVTVLAVGDTWCYARSFGRGKATFVIEKECIVLSARSFSGHVTLAIPPAQRKFLSLRDYQEGTFDDPAAKGTQIVAQEVSETSVLESTTKEASKGNTESTSAGSVPVSSSESSAANERGKKRATTPESDIEEGSKRVKTEAQGAEDEDLEALYRDAITVTITDPNELEARILEIEGHDPGPRFKLDAWRYVHCIRSEQPLGSLWELRGQTCNERAKEAQIAAAAAQESPEKKQKREAAVRDVIAKMEEQKLRREARHREKKEKEEQRREAGRRGRRIR
ncbi:hypothetical protein MMC13_001571 [Lambiella insularis]|nr:hypothetical protein [Lambiella insularis]